MRRSLLIIGVASAASACGAHKAVDKVKDAAASHDERQGTADATFVTPNYRHLDLELVADYQPLALDIAVFRQPGAFEAGAFAERLAAAAPTFAARLKYSGLSFRAGFFGADGALIGGEAFEADKPLLPAAIAGAFSAPLTGASAPFSAVAAAFDASPAFFRDGAALAVVVLQSAAAIDDPLSGEQLAGLLGEKVAAGVSVSALSPGADVCVRGAGVDGLDALVKATGGLAASVCADSWAGFFDRLIADGTNAAHFKVDLPSAPAAGSLKISAGATAILDYKQPEGTIELWLPRLIPAGAKIRVSYDREP